MTKLKLKVWIALLITAYEYMVDRNDYEAKFIKGVRKECEVKLMEEYIND